jgi:small-conductance mechanosensitive channel
MLRPRCLLVALAFAATPAAAQNPLLPQLRPAPDSVPRAPAPAAAPATIAPIDIPIRAGNAQARLSEVEALMRPSRPTVEVERGASRILDSLTRLSNRQLQLPESQVTRRALGDLASEWDRWGATVDDWLRRLRTRVGALDSARTQLVTAGEVWTRTVQRARGEAVAAEVLAEAEDVLQRIRTQDTAVLRRLKELVAVEVTLTKARLIIDGGRAAVEEAQARERRQLLRIDSPTFWGQFREPMPALREVARNHWTWAMDALRHFLAESRGRIVLLGLGMLGLLATILGLRRGLDWPAGPGAQAISRDERWMLAHPLASSILIAFVTVVGLFPRAPNAVYDLLFLLAAFPLWRVIPSLLPPELHRFGHRMTLLFVADRLAVMLLHSTPWHRVGSFAVALAALALTAIAIRRFPALDPEMQRRPTVRWLYRGALVGMALVATALLANLAGNVTLALVLTTGVATAAYLGLLLYAGAQVVDGVVSMGVRVTADDLKFVERHGAAIAHRVTQVVHLAAFAGWAGLLLILFYLWEPARALFTGILGASWSLGEARLSLAGILLFFGTIWVGALAGRWVGIVLEADILDRLDLPRGVPVTIASIVRYTLTAIAFFLALAAVGVDVSQLAIIGGALSVGVGFGLQTIVNNFISGLILAFERPLAIGDVVQIGELQGEVRSIGIRASVIRTFEGADVVVPNGQLISNELINWTRSDRTRRLEIPVGVAYGTDPATVISLLAEVAQGHDRVRTHPKPLCLFQGFGESSLDFVLRIWTDADDFPVVRSEVRVAVYEALRAAGIEIPFPQRDLHVRTLPPTQGAA